jgi:hypothetical protein
MTIVGELERIRVRCAICCQKRECRNASRRRVFVQLQKLSRNRANPRKCNSNPLHRVARLQSQQLTNSVSCARQMRWNAPENPARGTSISVVQHRVVHWRYGYQGLATQLTKNAGGIAPTRRQRSRWGQLVVCVEEEMVRVKDTRRKPAAACAAQFHGYATSRAPAA